MVETRSVRPEDEPLLYDLYRSPRLEELALLGWDAAQQEAFLRMQLHAQSRSYEWQFPEAEDRIILLEGRPVGRILVNRTTGEILLVDISLLPETRDAGIGTALLRELQAEAAAGGRPLRLSVRGDNHGARRLYQRLGFIAKSDDGMYCAMEWRTTDERTR